jgi:GMP synthase (glutamine-hydrolysing)
LHCGSPPGGSPPVSNLSMTEQILILDFGSQFTQLIARRVRELNVYCEIHPYNKIPIITPEIKGIILSGSPCSVRDEDAPVVDWENFGNKIPVLGICYGAQMMAQTGGGEVSPSSIREYGRTILNKIDNRYTLFKGIEDNTQVWMSHSDTITSPPQNADIIAATDTVKVAAFKIKEKPIYGIQFHPEVTHTLQGKAILKNFVVDICETSQNWTPASFAETSIKELKEKLGDDKVIMGLSGGVDSTVAATLIHHAIGKNPLLYFCG